MERRRIQVSNIGAVLRAKPSTYENTLLVKLIRKQGWKGIPPIPVIRLPQELITDGREYFQTDGWHRYAAAYLRSDTHIDSICYDANDDPEKTSKLTGNGHLEPYDEVIRVLKTRWADVERSRD